MILPRFRFVNVHVTVSPADTSMFVTGLPSSQVALERSQPDGTRSEERREGTDGRSLKFQVLESVGSESSSITTFGGASPPLLLNTKSCASLGCESSTRTILPRLRFVNVHVTVSPMLTLMLLTGLPSSQVALERSQPEGT